ncbi:class I SAM-dependent methyltransferase [Opitutus terrae]|uniref:Methyltransferase type 12 n=1 Tax=Opitutus terrae (strain DSM 11246 / JCM 15787 / PB90-1) TaxID=452637 RepID=B1ZZU3_OPITP|nr:class I SAM-dependent methyltransferase [Opitutus terrae]ACB77279.1 hypothetical protein Oter_4005 [Opitutus terrae PB90-1]
MPAVRPLSLALLLDRGDTLVASRDADAQRYWRENRRRIATAVARASELVPRAAPAASPARVLDIGPALEVELLAEFLPGIALETMGWADHRYQTPALRAHHPFDLNDAADPARWPRVERCDLILLLEVIEHVHISPLHVFRMLRSFLRPGGYLLVSTPNAAWLRNRWLLLTGHNPFELIREDPRNPGHFRELTRSELRRLLERAGLRVVALELDTLYAFSSASGRRFSRLARLLPPAFRHDMLCTVQRVE